VTPYQSVKYVKVVIGTISYISMCFTMLADAFDFHGLLLLPRCLYVLS